MTQEIEVSTTSVSATSQLTLFDPITFLERLCALVPRPRFPQVRYHGVLAPAARLRKRVVTGVIESGPVEPHCKDHAAVENVLADEGPSAARLRSRPYSSWATLMQRVFELDVLQCPCGGRRKIIALVQEREAIASILDHLGLSSEVPSAAPARAPPEWHWSYD